MKRLFLVAFFVLLSIGLTSLIYSAEYEVRKGDSLTKIAELTDHTIEELVVMNEIENPNLIFPSQKIKFLGKCDLVAARSGCLAEMERIKRDKESVSAHVYTFLENVIEDINKLNFRYSLEEPEGTFYTIIFMYADAWRSRTK